MKHKDASRRNFLKSAGVGLTALLFGSTASAADALAPGKQKALGNKANPPIKNIRPEVSGLYLWQQFCSYNGGQLNSFKHALTDPFMQFCGLCIIGDSITWGMEASGMSATGTRLGELSDARNNGKSPSWVNLLHKWLGEEYYDSQVVSELPWPGADGIAQFTYVNRVDIFPNMSDIVQVGSFSEYRANGSTLGVIWYVNMSSSGGGPHSFTWMMTGESFDLRFGVTPEGAAYRLYVDGVFQGQFDTSSIDLRVPAGFGYSNTHSFPFKKNAIITVEAVGGNVGRDTLRIESIRINRTLRVTNNGLIGISSARYKQILRDALRSDDSFCFVGLGTNDSIMPGALGSPMSPSALSNNLNLMLDHIFDSGVVPVLICANEVLDRSSRNYSMGQVRAAISRLADVRRVDFIDHYALTKRLQQSGVKYTSGSTHPNDLGHYLMFDNTRNSIVNSDAFGRYTERD
ncbi:hypothetical protein JJD84_11220 [Pseudomonas fluorescens]|nr:hypothetical protein [Pseudomonas fluorescens]